MKLLGLHAMFSINVRVEKLLPVQRKGCLNLSMKTIGSGVKKLLALKCQKI